MAETLSTISFPGLGLKFNLDRVALRIGNLPIYWYGIIIGLSFILAILYASKRAKEFGIDQDRLIDVILGGAIGGIVGARLYYVVFSWETYSQDLSQIFNTRNGGMAIYGGIIGALLVGGLMCRLRKVKFLPTADLAAGGFLIGQSIGRWGNFVNIEAFGSNTALPWGMSSASITNYLTQHEAGLEALGMSIDPNMPVHPTFLYESLWCALGFVLLALYTKHRKFDGELVLFYLAWYGAGRTVIEGLRTDSLMIPGTGLRISQVLAAVLVVCALGLWAYLRTKKAKASDPDFMPLYVTTDEAQLILKGEFYKTAKQKKALLLAEQATDQAGDSESKSEDESESDQLATPEAESTKDPAEEAKPEQEKTEE